MPRPPEQRRPVIRLLAVTLAIGLAVLALMAALVWRPLVSSLHLGPAPEPARVADAPTAGATAVLAGAARAP